MTLARGSGQTMRFRLIVSAMSGLVAVLLMAAPSGAATLARTATATCSASVSPVYHVNSTVVTDLRGNAHSGDLVTVDFVAVAASSGVPCRWSLTSYQAADSQMALAQQNRFLFTSAAGAGHHSLQVRLPSCYFQVDFANGPSIAKLTDTNRYGPRLLSADNGGSTSCVTVAAVAPDCSLMTGANVSSSFTFTNPSTTSIVVAVTRTVVGPPVTTTTLPAVIVPTGSTTFTFPAVEDATQSFAFLGRGINVAMPAATVDCLAPSATVQAVCDTATGVSTATLTVVNPDASPETVQVSANGSAPVPLLVGANSVPAMTAPLVFDPSSPLSYVVSDASEAQPFSLTVPLIGFSCISGT